MQATIEVSGLRKRFGPTLALDGMSFTVQPGQVTGFVGPNGAGKSTTMRVILALDAADEGQATVGGKSYASLQRPGARPGRVGQGRDHHQAQHPSGLGVRGDDGDRRSRGPDARQLHRGYRRAAWCRLGRPSALAAADSLRRHDHRLQLRRRHALGPGGQGPAHRAAVDRPGRHVRYLAGLHGDPELVRRSSNSGGPAQATGVFDHVSLAGGASGTWTGTEIGRGGPAGGGQGPGGGPAPFTRNGGRYTLTGSGDIAPVTPGPLGSLPTVTIGQSLAGAFVGLIAIVVVAAMFFSAEYRRGLIRTTLTATPRRGAVLAAKAVVIGAVAFVTGLVAAVVSIGIGVPKEEKSGQVLLTTPWVTDVRVVVGTAAMLALAAVFAVALGAILRRSAAAITIAVVTVVLPFLLAALNVVPAGVGDWLLRVTPAAGLAIEQSIPRYSQVTTVISPVQGYYPLSPSAGFAVLCLWAAAALALALVMLRRRDA